VALCAWREAISRLPIHSGACTIEVHALDMSQGSPQIAPILLANEYRHSRTSIGFWAVGAR